MNYLRSTLRRLSLAAIAAALVACGNVHDNKTGDAGASPDSDAHINPAVDAGLQPDAPPMPTRSSFSVSVPAGATRMTGGGMTLDVQLGSRSRRPASNAGQSFDPYIP